jgi:hypothetical protein
LLSLLFCVAAQAFGLRFEFGPSRPSAIGIEQIHQSGADSSANQEAGAGSSDIPDFEISTIEVFHGPLLRIPSCTPSSVSKALFSKLRRSPLRDITQHEWGNPHVPAQSLRQTMVYAMAYNVHSTFTGRMETKLLSL